MSKELISKKNLLLFAIILIGFFLRTFQLKERFLYGHDQDLASWFIKDVVIDKHFRLIGQETSTQGVFIGAFYYYLLVPFYIMSAMDPIGGTYLVTLLGIIGIISIYFVFSKVFTKDTGLIAAFIYSVSFYTIANDREVVPTMPVILWTVWFIYALNLLLKGKEKKAFILFGVLIGLIWHINFALVLTLILIPAVIILFKISFKLKNLIYGFSVLTLVSMPLLLFESRHGFQQIRAIYFSLTKPQSDVVFFGLKKFSRVIFLMSKNIHGLFMGLSPWITQKQVVLGILVVFVFITWKKILRKEWSIIFLIWVLTYVLFFSLYSKIVSEYYLNGTIIVFMAIVSLWISKLLRNENSKHWGVILLFLFFVYNMIEFFGTPINKSGYIQRKEIVSEIKKDSEQHNYPCVAISYITKPGHNLGYRYFMYLANLKTKHISEDVPVYTVVYPLDPIYPTDITRGAIGLIYPDYKRYNLDRVVETCQGNNSNIDDPIWGFPK